MTYPVTINLPDTTYDYYRSRALYTGKPVEALIARDLQEYAEHQQFYANYREKVRP